MASHTMADCGCSDYEGEHFPCKEHRTTAALLVERGQTHGSFRDNAHYAQRLRAFWRSSPAWDEMPPEHKEALDQMAGKFSRILSGQSTFRDHWDDVAGYARLATERCL